MNNKEIFRSIIERDASSIYENVRKILLDIIPPQFNIIANNVIKANESKWLGKLQDCCDMLVETSFINPETTLEEAVSNANATINGVVNTFLIEKLNIPTETLNIVLQLLYGVSI